MGFYIYIVHTLLNYVLHHVTPQSLRYHVTQWHVILGINHMTYQGIGHRHDHVASHDHLTVRALDARLVR